MTECVEPPHGSVVWNRSQNFLIEADLLTQSGLQFFAGELSSSNKPPLRRRTVAARSRNGIPMPFALAYFSSSRIMVHKLSPSISWSRLNSTGSINSELLQSAATNSEAFSICVALKSSDKFGCRPFPVLPRYRPEPTEAKEMIKLVPQIIRALIVLYSLLHSCRPIGQCCARLAYSNFRLRLGMRIPQGKWRTVLWARCVRARSRRGKCIVLISVQKHSEECFSPSHLFE